MSFFISDALAAAGTPAMGQGDSSFTLVMVGAIFIMFYFMLIRPQNKKAKEHQTLIQGLKKGDEVITSGGILAKVISLDDNYIKVSPADGLEINLQKSAVTTVLPKGTLKSL
jgi:preprotein translocase subunit YajC